MSDEPSLPLIGGTLCLDFANTVDFRGSERMGDRLGDYGSLLGWAAQAGCLDPRSAKRLAAAARRQPKRAARLVAEARALREAIYRVASAIAAGKNAPGAALATFNRAAFPLLGRSRLVPEDGALRPAWAGGPEDLERVLWPIAWSAFALFNGDELDRLRECAHEDCHWLFIDRSRNRSRRWCAMWNCGNVTKARRFRQRHG